jgi:hypothetical protein
VLSPHRFFGLEQEPSGVGVAEAIGKSMYVRTSQAEGPFFELEAKIRRVQASLVHCFVVCVAS